MKNYKLKNCHNTWAFSSELSETPRILSKIKPNFHNFRPHVLSIKFQKIWDHLQKSPEIETRDMIREKKTEFPEYRNRLRMT